MAGRDEVVVSLQRSGTEDEQAADLHRAVGMVVSATVVLVPSLPRSMVDDVHDGHVLVVSPSGEAHRAAVDEVVVRGLDAADAPVAARLTLVDPIPDASAVGDSSGEDVRFDRARLLEALRATGGDIGGALRRLGIPVPDAARIVRALEGVRGRGLPVPVRPRPVLVRDLDELAHGLCDWLPWCHPVPPDHGHGHTIDP